MRSGSARANRSGDAVGIVAMIRLIGPGGAGKSTIGARLAQRLGVSFVDLDACFVSRAGGISEYLRRHGYDAYARENVAAYCSLVADDARQGVVALSSGFMTYQSDCHPEYGRVRHELECDPTTFVLLPLLDREACVAEIVRRQLGRPFARPVGEEEAVIRARFDVHLVIPAPKIETMAPVDAVVAGILAVLAAASR